MSTKCPQCVEKKCEGAVTSCGRCGRCNSNSDRGKFCPRCGGGKRPDCLRAPAEKSLSNEHWKLVPVQSRNVREETRMNSLETVPEERDERWELFVLEFRSEDLIWKSKEDRVFWRKASKELEEKGISHV